MKNYSIIEDLAPNHWQNINFKNHSKSLQDCIKRNLILIRRYYKGKIKPTISIFKKILLPGYTQEFNSQILSSKNRFSQCSVPNQTAIQEISNQIIPIQLNSQNLIQPVVQKSKKIIIQLQQLPKIVPSVSLIQSKTKILNPKILSLLENFDFSENQQKKLLLREKNKCLFQIRSPRKMIPLKKSQETINNESKNQSSSNLFTSIYNDSTGFEKKKILPKKLQNQTIFLKFKSQQQDSSIDLSYIRNTYADQKSLSKKLFALMRHRKSTKILKAKLFYQLQQKNLQLNQQEKQNFTRNKYQKKISFERFNQSPDFKLKGNLMTQTYYRSSLNLHSKKLFPIPYEKIHETRVNFRQKRGNRKENKNILQNLRQRISLLDQNEHVKDLTPRMFGTNKSQRNEEKKYILPNFDQLQ